MSVGDMSDRELSELPVDTVDTLLERLPKYFTMCLASKRNSVVVVLCIADLRSPTLSLPALRWGSPATLTYFIGERGVASRSH